MERGPLADRVTTAFETMPGSCKRLLATFSPPQNVVLLSMHEQACRAMNRLAQRFRVDGYKSICELCTEAMRNQGVGFAGKAGLRAARAKLKGECALAAGMAKSLTKQPPDMIEQLVVAAARLGSGRHVRHLVVWLCQGVDWHIYCVLSPLSGRRDLLKGIAPIGHHPLALRPSRACCLLSTAHATNAGRLKARNMRANTESRPSPRERAPSRRGHEGRGHSVLAPTDGASARQRGSLQ
jgi:hypothetical protein